MMYPCSVLRGDYAIERQTVEPFDLGRTQSFEYLFGDKLIRGMSHSSCSLIRSNTVMDTEDARCRHCEVQNWALFDPIVYHSQGRYNFCEA